MAETPPSELRKRLERKNAALLKLEAEFQEHLEFTTCERQFLFIEKGIDSIEKQNDLLRSQVQITFNNFDSILELVQSRFEEKSGYFKDLRVKAAADLSNRSLGSAEDGLSTVPINVNLLDEVVTTFGEMSSLVREQRATNVSEGKSLFTSLDLLESSRKDLQTNLNNVRRLSADRNSLGRTTSESKGGETLTQNLLDLSLPCLPEEGFVNSDVKDLEKRLSEKLIECRELASANLELQTLITAKDLEIQELAQKLHNYEQEDDSSSPPESFCQSANNFSYSGLPTIQETRESLDSIFDGPGEKLLDRLSGSKSAFSGSTNTLQPPPQDEAASPLSRILCTELDHCMLEIQDRNEHIALLYKTFHQLLASKRKEAVVPDQFVISEDETLLFDNAQLKADSCDSYMDLLQKLEKVLASIHRNIETTLSLPEFKLGNTSDSKCQPTESVNESIFSSSMAPCAQEMCSVVLEASVADYTQNYSPATVQTAKKTSHVDILKRVRNLMSTLMGILTNFNSDVLNVVDELLRFEGVLEKINKTIFGEEAFLNEEIYLYDDFCTKMFLSSQQTSQVSTGDAVKVDARGARGQLVHPSLAPTPETDPALEKSSCGMGDSTLHLSVLERSSGESNVTTCPSSILTQSASVTEAVVAKEAPDQLHRSPSPTTTTDCVSNHLTDSVLHSTSTLGDTTLHLSMLERSSNEQTESDTSHQQLDMCSGDASISTEMYNPRDDQNKEHADCLSAQKLNQLLDWLLTVKSKLLEFGVNIKNKHEAVSDSFVSERVLLLVENLKTELELTDLSSSPIYQKHLNNEQGPRRFQLDENSILKSSPSKPLQDLSNLSNKENSCGRCTPTKNWNQIAKPEILPNDDLVEKGKQSVQQLEESSLRLLKLEELVPALEQELQQVKQRLAEAVEDSSKNIADLTSFNSDLNTNLCLKSSECLDLLERLETSTAELVVLRQKVEADELASLRLTRELEELKKIGTLSGERIVELERTVSALQSALERARENWTELIKSSHCYLDNLSNTRKVVELDTIIEKVKLSKNLETIESALLKMDQAVLQLTGRERDFEDTIASKDRIIHSLQQESTKLCDEIENLQCLKMQVEVELGEVKESLALMKSDLTESLDEMSRLKDELLAATDERTRLADLLNEAKNELADSSELDEAKRAILKMSSELEEAKVTILELKSQIDKISTFNTPNLYKAAARRGQKETPGKASSSRSGSTTPISCKASAQLDESTLDSYVQITEDPSRHEASCAQVDFERSVFAGDLLADRTLGGVDPLSMTVAHGEFLEANPGYSSDDSEFATPLASRSNRNSPMKRITPRDLSIKEGESIEVLGKLKICEDELQRLKEDNDRMSHSSETTKLVLENIGRKIDSTFLALQDDIPESDIEQKVTIVADKIADLAHVVKGLSDGPQVDLAILVKSLVEDRMRAGTLRAQISNYVHSEAEKLRDECGAIKNSILLLNSTIEQNINEAVSSFGELSKNYELLIEQLADRSRTIDSLRKDNEKFSEEIARLTRELGSVKDEIDNNAEENASLQRKLIESESLCANLIVEKGSLVESKNDLKQKILGFVQLWRGDLSPRSSLDEAWDSIILEVPSLKKSADALKAAVETREIFLGLNTIKNECKKLHDAATCSQNEVAASLAKASEVVRSLANEASIQESLKAKALILEEQLSQSQDQIAKLQITIEESTSACEGLRKNLKNLEEENRALCLANESLEKAVEETSAAGAKEYERLKMENEVLSADIASCKETVTDLSDQLTTCRRQLAELKETVDKNCTSCSSHESNLKTVTSALTSLVVSTANQPIDLSCHLENSCDIISFTNDVLKKSNEIISAILQSLNLTDVSGLDALKSIHNRLNQSEIEDAAMCKKKMCEEICGMDAEVNHQELFPLTLVELQSRLVSVIMEKEMHLINDFQMRYDKQIASKDEELKCLLEKEKRTNEYNQHLLKECENLERTLSSHQTKANPTTQCPNNLESSPNKKSSIQRDEKDRHAAYVNEIKMLKDQIEVLERNHDELKSSSTKEIVELKGFLHSLVECLESFVDRMDGSESFDVKLPSFFLDRPDSVVESLHRLISEVFKKFGHQQVSMTSAKKESHDRLETISRLNDCISDLSKQKDESSSATARINNMLLKNNEILKSKEQCISAMEQERVELQARLEEMNALLRSKELEINDLKLKMESQLAKCLADHQSNVAGLKNSELTDGLGKALVVVKGLSTHLGSTKDEVLNLQRENRVSMGELVSKINNRVMGIVNDEKDKLAESFDTKIKELHQDLKSLKDEKNQLMSENSKLEKSVVGLESEKETLNKRLKELREQPIVAGHDEDTCPYSDKLSEFKKEVYIARQRVEDEKKRFDMMKVNMEEELAMKCSSIKELESRIETTANEFKQRLSTVTVSYNQKCSELERCEATVSLLRDMNAEDKRRLEKELDSLAKELTRLQWARKFVEELGVDTSPESLAAVKKKISDADDLAKQMEELVEKNAELDSECEFMNREIKFLELRNTETYKECVEKTECLENLKKEHERALAEVRERLETELSCAKQLAVQSQNELIAELADVRGKLASQAEANAQLQSGYSQLENSLEACNKKILIYVNQIRDQEQTIFEKDKSNQELQLALDTQLSKLAQLATVESEIVKLQQLLQQNNVEIESMRRVVDKKAQVEATLLQRIQALEIDNRREADSLKAAVVDREQKIESLEKMLFEASQVDRIDKYKSKITSLEREVALLKQEAQSNLGAYLSPRRVEVQPVSQPDMAADQLQKALHVLDKKYQVVKKLAAMRRNQLVEYEQILKKHNINVPSISQRSDNTS